VKRFDFSITVPLFNKREYVRAALDSILAQDGVTVQLLVYDAGSTDGSWEIIQEELTSDRAATRRAQGWELRAVQEPDRGQSHAINKGLLASEGNLVAWLNADDGYYPGVLQAVRDYFASHAEVGLAYGDLDCVSASGALLKRRASRRWDREQLLHSYCFIPQPATFWRREMIAIAGLLDVSLHLAMDYDYWLRLSAHTKVGQIPTVIGFIRIMEGTKTGTTPLTAMPEALRVGRRHGARYLSKFRLAYWLWRLGAAGLVRWAARRIDW
jgi:glycosyltransferase involved in cell wall biosynthesis